MMNVIVAFWRYERRKFFSKKYVAGFLALLAIVLAFHQYNTLEYKNTLAQVDSFKDFEYKKVDQFFNYRIYSTYGFRLMFQPAPLSIFFNNSVTVSDLNAFADGGERFYIYKPVYGKKIFDLKKNWVSDFSEIIMLIGGLLVLFYGCFALANMEYLRFLTSIAGKRKLFWGLYAARAIWILTGLLVITACSFLLILFNGVAVPIDWYVLTSFLTTFTVLLFFFSVGFACGTAKSKLSGIGTAILIWGIFIFILPTGVNIITVNKADTMTPIQELESTKLKIFSDWEKEWQMKEGPLKLGDKKTGKVQDYMLHSKENVYKKLQELEDKMIGQMENNTRFYQFLSSLFPTTYYQSVNNEISSRGYNELSKFCRYSRQQKVDFINMIIDREYLTGYSRVEAFNKDDANIYKARPSLPAYYLLGLIMTLLYISVSVAIAYSRFNTALFGFPQEKKGSKYEPKHIILEKGKINSWQETGNLLNRLLYNLFSGEPQWGNNEWPDFQVVLDGLVLNTSRSGQDFLYLCHYSAFPGEITVAHFLNLVMDLMALDRTRRKQIGAAFRFDSFGIRKFSQLSKDELGVVLLAILEMKPFTVYLIDDVEHDATFEFCTSLNKKMLQLAETGTTVVFLFDTITFRGNFNRPKPGKESAPFQKSNVWLQLVKQIEEESNRVKMSMNKDSFNNEL